VVIVGGGVVGLSTALECARRGHSVVVLERNGERRDGCSYGNTGMIVPSHFVPLAAPGAVALALKWMLNPASPFYVKPRLSLELARWGLDFWRAATFERARRAAPLLVRLALAGRAGYEALAGTGDDFGFRNSGVLILCRDPHTFEEEARAALEARALGLTTEVLDAKATAAREPGIKMDVAGAVYVAQDCNLDPARLMDVLQRHCAAAGVELRWQTEVGGWRVNGTRIDSVQAGGETLGADEFVLCAGVWTGGLGRELGLRLPMQAGKGYSLTLANPARSPKGCALLTEARVAVSPMSGKLRFGGTMELAGIDESINPIRVRGIIEAVKRYYPEFSDQDFAGIEPWRGLRPCTPDGLPYVGRTAKAQNLVVAAGHAMMGISLAPITAKLAADAIDGAPAARDVALLSPDRFH
jgi:D-amino-acid dehydrogenase